MCGYGEILKHSLIDDKKFFNFLNKNGGKNYILVDFYSVNEDNTKDYSTLPKKQTTKEYLERESLGRNTFQDRQTNSQKQVSFLEEEEHEEHEEHEEDGEKIKEIYGNGFDLSNIFKPAVPSQTKSKSSFRPNPYGFANIYVATN